MSTAILNTQSRPNHLKLRYPGSLIAIALALGWLFDWAFYAKQIGIGAFLYTSLLVGALYFSGRLEQTAAKRSNLTIVVPLLFFAAMLFIRSNPFLTFLNVCCVVLLLLLLTYYYGLGDWRHAGPLTYPLAALDVSIHALVDARYACLQVEPSSDKRTRALFLTSLRGLLLALPVVLVFAVLLISADLIFAQRIDTLLQNFALEELLTRGLLMLTVGWLALGSLTYALSRPVVALTVEMRAKSGEARPSFNLRILGLGETAIVLNTVNLLFISFVILQIEYLFGGVRNIAIDGFTYAEYARRGFFEMVAVSILAFALILLLRAVVKRQGVLFSVSASVMIACVIVMLFSAFKRLRLYELTYGYTELRLYSHLFMPVIGLALLWLAVSLWRNLPTFIFGLMLIAFSYPIGLNLLNPDRLIVEQNWARYQLHQQALGDSAQINLEDYLYREIQSGASLDLFYLMQLSNDSLAALTAIADRLPQDAQSALEKHLLMQGESLALQQASQPWQSYHLGESSSLELLMDKYRFKVDDSTGQIIR